MTPCDRRGVLSRTGTSQTDRTIAQRDPGYFQIDGRDIGDMILFGRRFAQHIKYYDANNRHIATDPALRDWTAFFDRDISAILASLAKLPVAPCRAAFQDIRTFLEADPSRPEAELTAHFDALFHIPLTLYRDMAGRMATIEDNDPIWPILTQLSQSDIAGPLGDLAGYHKGAVGQNLVSVGALDRGAFTLNSQPGPGPKLADQVADLLFTKDAFDTMPLPLRALASFAPDGWGAFYAAQASNDGPFLDGADPYSKIFDGLNLT